MPQPNQEAFNAEVTEAGITAPGTTISDTDSGIIVGTDPKPQAPARTEITSETKTPEKSGKYSDEDLARVRQQEKDKLYPQFEALKTEVNQLKKEREEREAVEQAALLEAEEEARRKAEAETDVRDLLSQKEREWAAQLEEERKQRETAFELLNKEREYQALAEYRAARLAEEAEIMPQLQHLVQGNSQDEIEASIASTKELSASIFESAASAMQTNRREMVGARVTAPSVGPVDTNSEQQQFTPEAIQGMSINEYAKHRQRLLGTNPTARGIFG